MKGLWKEPTSLFQNLGDSNLTSRSLMHVHFPASYNSDGAIPSKKKELYFAHIFPTMFSGYHIAILFYNTAMKMKTIKQKSL